MYVVFCFFFFKQKTAYEMRISDWSSDVCSSDLVRRPLCIIDIEFHFHFRALTVVDDRSSAGIQYREIGNRTIRRSRGCNEELAAVDLSLEYILDIGRQVENITAFALIHETAESPPVTIPVPKTTTVPSITVVAGLRIR